MHILPSLVVGVLVQYGLSCSHHERAVPKGYKVISSPGFSPYNLRLSVFSYSMSMSLVMAQKKLPLFINQALSVRGWGEGDVWC